MRSKDVITKTITFVGGRQVLFCLVIKLRKFGLEVILDRGGLPRVFSFLVFSHPGTWEGNFLHQSTFARRHTFPTTTSGILFISSCLSHFAFRISTRESVRTVSREGALTYRKLCKCIHVSVSCTDIPFRYFFVHVSYR